MKPEEMPVCMSKGRHGKISNTSIAQTFLISKQKEAAFISQIICHLIYILLHTLVRLIMVHSTCSADCAGDGAIVKGPFSAVSLRKVPDIMVNRSQFGDICLFVHFKF